MEFSYKPNRVGTVLVFKPGVTEEEAQAALKQLAELLDDEPTVQHFDDRWGSPAWYIP